MQSHNGVSFSNSHQNVSILAMIQDGVQGTDDSSTTDAPSSKSGTSTTSGGGAGLVQLLNIYGNPYSAARGYNSGYIPTSGNLSEAAGATACYVSDIANRLTGCVNAKSTCPDDTAL